MTIVQSKVKVDIEISLLSDLTELVLFEAEEFSEARAKWFSEVIIKYSRIQWIHGRNCYWKIQKGVKVFMKDLIDNVEKAVFSPQKKPLFRKRPFTKADWELSKKKNSHQLGLNIQIEMTN